MLVDIKGHHLELFGGWGQQYSHGTGDGAWTKITNAKGGVTEKALHYTGPPSSNFTTAPLTPSFVPIVCEGASAKVHHKQIRYLVTQYYEISFG